MADKVQVGSGGCGFFGIMFLVFLALKLGVGNTVVMGWSWWAVFAPLWGPTAVVLGIFLIIIIVAIIGGIIAACSG